ncbi:hypothetical protein RKD30_003592 [Streptomyces pristinaespiralis]
MDCGISLHSVYRMAAAGSLPGEPKFPLESTSGIRIDHGWARRTRAS